MSRIERDPIKKIEAIDSKIGKIIEDIVFEVEMEFLDDGDDVLTAHFGAEECWPNKVYIPCTKAEAIKILDDPNKSKLDKLGATLYAEVYKKSRLQKAHGIKSNENSSFTILS